MRVQPARLQRMSSGNPNRQSGYARRRQQSPSSRVTKNDSVILVGTGEANSSADSYYGLGILRSANAGTSWTLISTDTTGTRSFAGMAFSKIAFSSAIPSFAVAATAGASEGIIEGLADPLTANLGLYDSGDGGNTWRYANVTDNRRDHSAWFRHLSCLQRRSGTVLRGAAQSRFLLFER